MVSIRKAIETHNNHIHSDSKKQSEERAALFAAGDVKRWVGYTIQELPFRVNLRLNIRSRLV